MLVARADYDYNPNYLEDLKPKPAVKKKRKVKKLDKKMYIYIAIILFITSLFILTRYAKITEARLEITKLEKEVLELQQVKMNLEGNLEALKSTTKISEEAINNLGMIYPEDGQIVYVSINEETDLEVASNSLADIFKGVFK